MFGSRIVARWPQHPVLDGLDTIELLLDAGCEHDYYASDITRTFPVSGKFTAVQRAVYEVVLEAQLAAIDKVRPGNDWNDPHEAAVRVITDAYRAEWAKLGKAEAELPLLGVNRHIVIADSDEEAFEIARVAYPAWLGSLLLLWRERGVDPGIRFPQDAAEAIEGRFLFAGTAASVRESIAELVGATGINYLLCRFAFGNMPFEASLRSVAIFIDEVLPAFD